MQPMTAITAARVREHMARQFFLVSHVHGLKSSRLMCTAAVLHYSRIPHFK